SGEPAEWLGDEKYKTLAATIKIKGNDTSRIPVWFKAKPNSEKLLSLSALLTNAYKPNRQPPNLSWAIEAEDGFPGTRKVLEGDAEYLEALVNYSKLARLYPFLIFENSS
ncbi:MAG: hypothetical protein M3Q78_06365, partial [Acidobacteriota bacterium]|nr:hypothetical protein [Acidobacteriota bacterium]